ncbi:MAG: phosphotransferase [Alphaproteobacteria bacterium]|nr:phosphotransferase [Alphaproteobacteria bacterium]
MTARPVPAPLRTFAADHLGPGLAFEERTVPYGEADVWTVSQEGEVVAWLKRHRFKSKARQERAAYERWIPRLAVGVPRLIAACEEVPEALLVAHVPGERADKARLEGDALHEVYRRIGEVVGHLHALPHDDADAVDPVDALRARCASWCERAVGEVAPELIDVLDAWFAEPMPAVRRVPCHRDLQLHNVIVDVDRDLAVTVIDFGHARADVWLVDLVKLFQLPGRVPTAARAAFLQGYGRRLQGSELDLAERLRALHGLATWVWARDHADRRAAELGRRVLNDALEARGVAERL